MEVVVLKSNQDGLRQIAAALEGRRDIAGVHVVSHGGPAMLKLGTLTLDSGALAARVADLGIIRAALLHDAELFLYGCNVAQGDAGQRFIAALAKATGAQVAASTNLTGARELGGDWLLESRTSTMRLSSLDYPAYRAVLPTVAGTVALPFGHPDTAFQYAKLTDGLADTGTTDIPGVVYEFFFADVGNTQTGRITNVDLAGGTGSMMLYYNIGTGEYGTVRALIIKTQLNRMFGLSQFRIQDAQGLGAVYTATPYRNNVAGTAYNFSTSGNTNPVLVTLPSQFNNIDEIRITSNGGIGGQGANLWQEGFNNFVFIDPTANADLSGLSSSQGSFTFNANTTAYSFSVPFATTSTTITPTVDTPGATVTVNGVTVASGAASAPIALNAGSNTITTIVTSKDGNVTKTYTLTVSRIPSTNANLSALALSSGTLTPGFAGGTTSYTASVSNATSSLTVTPTVADSTATLTVNGVSVASGNASGPIALSVGSNTITTVVTAQDGTTTKTYTITVTRAASSNANLAALSLSSGTLAPVFNAATTGYTASVGNATTSITVTPTVADSNAVVTVNGVAVTSASASGAISLAVGNNTITTVVTAQNGATKTYTVTVTRAASANADLSALSLSSGTLAPAFAAATTGYTASVSNATTSITVTPTVAHSSATVTVNGVVVGSGNASGAIALALGNNIISTVVTAQDGTTSKTYTVTVTRALSADADLSALSISSGTLAPAFASGTLSYTASVSNATTSLTVTPNLSSGTASVTVNGVAVNSGNASGLIPLAVGNNTITVEVTAQNGTTTKSYTVTVIRAASSNANLSALSLSSGTLAPAFAASTISYSASVANATTALTVTPTVADSNAVVRVNGVVVTSGAASGAIALNVGNNTITTEVTAANGTTTKTYTVTVTRAASTNANLSALSLSSGTLAPGFNAATLDYMASVGNTTTSLTVTATVADSAASITVNGEATTSGSASAAIPLNVGDNTITTRVTAQNGVTKTYTVTVTRAVSSNADLSALALSNGTLAPVFNSATIGYSASVGNATTSLTVTPTVANGAATVTVNGVAVTSGSASGAIALNVGNNTITTVVTAQSGTTKTYTVTVTRSASANADLAALSLSNGTLAPVFAAATNGYTASVGNATTALTLTPTVAAAGASVTVNGVAVTSGSASGAIALNVGANTITTVVTAPDGTTTNTYTVTVTRAASANADLSALSLSSGTLTPAFGSGTTSYTASVSNATTSLTVTPTVAAGGASTTVNGVAVASGSASAAIALTTGANTITTVVTAPDGTTTKTYTVTVTRAAAANADLSALALSNGALAPAFTAGTTAYTAGVGNATTSLTITPTVADASATVTVNGVAVASGAASGAIALNVGSNTITTVVTAQDGTTTKTYTVTVVRAASGNADLAALSLSNGTLAPAFSAATTAYTASVSNATTSLSVTPTVAATSSVTVNGVTTTSGSASAPVALTVGANTITIVVTAQNGATKTYTVTVTRATSANAALSALSLSSGTLDPAFSAGQLAYSASVQNAVTAVSVTAAVADGSASVTVNGAAVASGSASAPIALAIGTNSVTIVVTAQNGSTSTTTITVTRAASPATASLSGLVYSDANNDGIKDALESALPGITVKLNGTDIDGGAVDLSSVTGADGSYTFNALKGGTYALTEVQPAGLVDGKETAGTLGGTVDNGAFDDSAAHNRIGDIVVATGQNGTGYLFGEQSNARLQGFVYLDANNNGLKDSGETGLAGIRITLSTGAAPAPGEVATSAADGSFAFAGVKVGTYTLRRTPAEGTTYEDGRERAGAAGGVINDTSFGTQASQLSITTIRIDAAILASTSGKIDGYLFGLRTRNVPGLKLPIIKGAVLLKNRAAPAAAPGSPAGALSSKPAAANANTTRILAGSAAAADGISAIVGGWTVTLSQNGNTVCSVLTNAEGEYQFNNLVCPGYEQSGLPTGSGFALRFNKVGSTLTGIPESGGDAGTETVKTIDNITLSATDEISEQNLPLDPGGMIYDAVTRLPLAGATIVITGPAGFNPATHLVGGAALQRQVTGNDGMYQYLLQNGFPSGVYTLSVAGAPLGYGTTSALLAPCAGTLNVGATPNPALVQASAQAPATGTVRHDPANCSGLVAGGAATTQYYLSLQITNGVSAPILNNHIPLDAAVATGLALGKSADKRTAELGDTVRYTIVLQQAGGTGVLQSTVRDVLPAGFRFIPGTVTVNGVRAADPMMGPGAVMGFNLGGTTVGRQVVLGYRVRVGVGSMQGDGVNRARAYACNNAAGCLDAATLAALPAAVASNEASVKVQVSGGVFTNDACVAGKVFTDCNRNGMQDSGERGIPAVRLYLEDGTHLTTDGDGKYSYCGLSPMAHVIKLDSTTLPAGSVLGETSNRNLGDPDSLLLDARNGELLRADFAETSCSAAVLDQVKKLRSPSAAPPPTRRPGVTFSSKDNSKVNKQNVSGQPSAAPAKGVQHAQ